jgi:hypothetical protein
MPSTVVTATAAVPVAWREPFSMRPPYLGRRPVGETIADIVASVPDLPVGFRLAGRVCINGEEVPRELWAYVRPKPYTKARPIAVTLHWPLHGGGRDGGGGGKSIIALVGSIALTALTGGIAGGSIFGGITGIGEVTGMLGTSLGIGAAGGAYALAGAVGIAGALQIEALSR